MNARAPVLDLVSALADSPERPLDFALVLRLEYRPGLDDLRRGAESARLRYPKTGCVLRALQWVPSPETAVPLRATRSGIEEFLEEPLDLESDLPLRQLFVDDPAEGPLLVTRLHHAAGDLLSLLMWVGHQLRVTPGAQEPTERPEPLEEPRLRTHPRPVFRSLRAFPSPCDPLRARRIRPGRTRRWKTLVLAVDDLRARAERVHGFTYNDLLAAAAMETLRKWNGATGPRVGLWFPINIRSSPFVGFGNGSSRIKLYDRAPASESLLDRARRLRCQIDLARGRGEWAVPERSLLTHLPRFVAAPLIRAYLRRPGLDACTALFSHVERIGPGKECAALPRVCGVETVAMLHRTHSLAIAGVTFRNRTRLTFTYDPARLAAGEVDSIIALFRIHIAQARRELDRCAAL